VGIEVGANPDECQLGISGFGAVLFWPAEYFVGDRGVFPAAPVARSLLAHGRVGMFH
jgi:hypothetical protein